MIYRLRGTFLLSLRGSSNTVVLFTVVKTRKAPTPACVPTDWSEIRSSRVASSQGTASPTSTAPILPLASTTGARILATRRPFAEGTPIVWSATTFRFADVPARLPAIQR